MSGSHAPVKGIIYSSTMVAQHTSRQSQNIEQKYVFWS